MADLLDKTSVNCLFILKKDECQLIYDSLVLAKNHLIRDLGVSRLDDSIIRRAALMTAFSKALKE